MTSFDKVKIVVVGDSGVGKTSLVHLISKEQPISNPYWTIGCAIEVKMHDFKVGTPNEKVYCIEMWDVGGCTAHKNSRSIFYTPCHGIILVHDLTNFKSMLNLRSWLSEVLQANNRRNGTTNYDLNYTDTPVTEHALPNPIPVLVVGTKLDAHDEGGDGILPASSHPSRIAAECGADEILLDAQSGTKTFAAGSTNAVKLSRFFDKVVERKFHGGAASPQITYRSDSFSDRRPRGVSPYSSPTDRYYGSRDYND